MRTIGKIMVLLFLPLAALEAYAQDDLYMNILQRDSSVIRIPVKDILEVKIEKGTYNLRPISIHVSDRPLGSETIMAAPSKKTPPTTKESLKKFYLNYVYNQDNQVVCGVPELYTYDVDNGTWLVGTTTDPGTGGWPSTAGNDASVTFYAYANVDVFVGDGDMENEAFFLEDETAGPYLEFGMDEYTQELGDLLVAQNTDTWTNCEGNLYLAFDHACAAMEFYICKTASLADYVVNVNNVKIHNVPSLGHYFFNSGEWEVITEYQKDYTVYANQGDDSGNSITVKQSSEGKDLLIGDGDYMFVIPQTLTPWDKNGSPLNSDNTYIEINCKISKDDQYLVGGNDSWGVVYLPFEATLKKGSIHPFTIQMGTALRDASGNKIFQ